MKHFGKFDLRGKKVAIVCDWLTNYAGAERVISAISEVFPDAPIFTSVYNKEKMREFARRDVRESFISHLPFGRRLHQLYILLMPYAFEAIDLSDYDVVISSSHACAKGVITGTDTVHVCYCHSPMRYLWDGCHEYVRSYGWYRWPFRRIIDFFLTKLRIWDVVASSRPDYFLANSKFVAERIKKYYMRESTVIYPPVESEKFKVSARDGEYYLAVGRLIPYKRFDLLVDAFNLLGLPLYIIGEGKEFVSLKARAKENISFLGFVSEAELAGFYGGAKAFLFPQVEDFGIAPIEAMAAGKPVIAYGKGGALETIIDGRTGVFFSSQEVNDIVNAVRKCEKMIQNGKFDSSVIRAHAETFCKERFQKELIAFIRKVSSV